MKLLGSLMLGLSLFIGAGSEAIPLKKDPLLKPLREARLKYEFYKTTYKVKPDGSMEITEELTSCHGETFGYVYDGRGIKHYTVDPVLHSCELTLYGQKTELLFIMSMDFSDIEGVRTAFRGGLYYMDPRKPEDPMIYDKNSFSVMGMELNNAKLTLKPQIDIHAPNENLVEVFRGTLELIDNQRP